MNRATHGLDAHAPVLNEQVHVRLWRVPRSLYGLHDDPARLAERRVPFVLVQHVLPIRLDGKRDVSADTFECRRDGGVQNSQICRQNEQIGFGDDQQFSESRL